MSPYYVSFSYKTIVILLLWDLLNVSRITEGLSCWWPPDYTRSNTKSETNLKYFETLYVGGCFQGLFACFWHCYFVLMRELCGWQQRATKKLNIPLMSRQHQDTLPPSVVLLVFDKKAYFIWHFPLKKNPPFFLVLFLSALKFTFLKSLRFLFQPPSPRVRHFWTNLLGPQFTVEYSICDPGGPETLRSFFW